MKPEKPLYREPCNGCGVCCILEQCKLSEEIFGQKTRCPALVDAGERYACGLVAEPSRWFKSGLEAEGARKAGELLGIGTFCDSVETREDAAIAEALGE